MEYVKCLTLVSNGQPGWGSDFDGALSALQIGGIVFLVILPGFHPAPKQTNLAGQMGGEAQNGLHAFFWFAFNPTHKKHLSSSFGGKWVKGGHPCCRHKTVRVSKRASQSHYGPLLIELCWRTFRACGDLYRFFGGPIPRERSIPTTESIQTDGSMNNFLLRRRGLARALSRRSKRLAPGTVPGGCQIEEGPHRHIGGLQVELSFRLNKTLPLPATAVCVCLSFNAQDRPSTI